MRRGGNGRKAMGVVLVLGFAAMGAAGCGSAGRAVPARAVCLMGGFADEAPPVCLWIDGRVGPGPEAGGKEADQLRVHLRVANGGVRPVLLTPDTVTLTTEQGEKGVGARAWQGGRRVWRMIVSPGEEATVDMVASVPGPAPESCRQLRFNLPYYYGASGFTLGATFSKPPGPLAM